MIFVMVFETLQHGILADEGANLPGHQICTQIVMGQFSPLVMGVCNLC
jgi:hypothetical protein